MGVEITWRTQIGRRTDDNRDCAGLGIREAEALCIVLDGSTTGQYSGELARHIAREIVDWYVTSDKNVSPKSVVMRLQQLHDCLPDQYAQSSASYMIVHFKSPSMLHVLHAGDCLLGRTNGRGAIKWLTRPHTLASVDNNVHVPSIIRLPERHRLTRSFRKREFMLPDLESVSIERELLVATDGFWADLSPHEQSRFMDDQNVPMSTGGDDRSVLKILLRGDNQSIATQHAHENFYVKTNP